MNRTKFQTLIDHHLGDMGRRGCTDDPILTYRRTLERFARIVSPQNDGGVTPIPFWTMLPENLSRRM